ncbi:MAG TPA: hypothetical protein VF604_17900 [Pyrinomonadaceae bacterium]|jgi:hypothetical protein
MTEKWFESSWANATPLIIFIIFMMIFLAGQQVLNVCNESNSSFCSSIDIKKHILFAPQKVFTETDGKPGLIKDKDKDGNETETYAVSRRILANRYSGQIVWIFFVGINILISIIGLTIYLLLAVKTKKYKYVVCGLIITLAFGIIALIHNSPIIMPIIDSAIKTGDGGIAYIEYAVKLLNFLAVTTMMATVLTISAILFRHSLRDSEAEEKSQESVERKLRDLSEQVEDLRLVIYFATAMLIVGVLQISSLLSWTATFFPENELNSFFSTITFVIGSSYTLLLAAIYLPAYYVLQNRATIYVNASLKSTAADSLQNKEDLPKDYKLQFFSFSFIDSLPRVLVILAPLLTGTISEQFIRIFNSLAQK